MLFRATELPPAGLAEVPVFPSPAVAAEAIVATRTNRTTRIFGVIENPPVNTRHSRRLMAQVGWFVGQTEAERCTKAIGQNWKSQCLESCTRAGRVICARNLTIKVPYASVLKNRGWNCFRVTQKPRTDTR